MSAVVSPTAIRQTFDLPDIHCAGCVSAIERVLQDSKVVDDFDVSLATRKVDVVTSADATQVEQLLADAGFRALSRSQDDRLDTSMLARLGVAGIGMMQVMMFALAEYLAGTDGLHPLFEAMMRWASLALATLIVLYSAQPFYQGAFRDLRQHRVGMDLPITLAIMGAYGVSVLATISGGPHVYFDSVCMFAFLLLLGRYLERIAARRVRMAGRLADQVLPATATLVSTGEPTPLSAVSVGDVVQVNADAPIPVDGYVVSGNSGVQESVFTGENWPVIKEPGHAVYAGTWNIEATLTVRASRPADEFLISRLSRLIDLASQHKPAFAILADRIARHFVSAVLAIAALAGLFWYMTGAADWFVIMLTVLVVSCPCALSLATPIAYAWAITTLQRRGLAVSQGRFLEDLNRITHVVIDKTGTLTTAKPTISAIRLLDTRPGIDPLAIAATLEADSRHPLANAFRRYLPEAVSSVSHLVYSPEGVTGTIDGQRYVLGNPGFVSHTLAGATLPETPDEDGTWLLLADDNPLAWFQLQDDLRDDAVTLIRHLKQQSDVTMLSGDSEREAARIAGVLDIDHYRARQKPEDKLAYIRSLQREGGVILVIGDGINDAGALAAADCSIAINPADLVVQSSADATATGGDFKPLLTALDYVRKVRRVIRQNIVWAIGYNVCMMPLAAMGVVAPWAAALGMSLSSLLVVLNASRLAGVRQPWK